MHSLFEKRFLLCKTTEWRLTHLTYKVIKLNNKMVVGGSKQKVRYLSLVSTGARQQGISVISRGLTPLYRLDLVSSSFTVKDVTTELSRPLPTSCRTEINCFIYQFTFNITFKWKLIYKILKFTFFWSIGFYKIFRPFNWRLISWIYIIPLTICTILFRFTSYIFNPRF